MGGNHVVIMVWLAGPLGYQGGELCDSGPSKHDPPLHHNIIIIRVWYTVV